MSTARLVLDKGRGELYDRHDTATGRKIDDRRDARTHWDGIGSLKPETGELGISVPGLTVTTTRVIGDDPAGRWDTSETGRSG